MDRSEVQEIRETIHSCYNTITDCRNKIIECNNRLIDAGCEIVIRKKARKVPIPLDKFNAMCDDIYAIVGFNFMMKSNKPEKVAIRYTLMYLLRTKIEFSLKEIGTVLSGKDHATVSWGLKVTQNMLDTNNDEYIKFMEIIKPIFDKHFK